MKVKLLTHASDIKHPGFIDFITCVKKYGYDITVLQDPTFNWANGSHVLLDWCETDEAQGYTHLLVSDSYDVVVVGGLDEVIRKYLAHYDGKVVYSSEKACFPRAEWSHLHKEEYGPWRFINCGGLMAPIDKYIKMWKDNEKYKPKTNEQEWAMANYLFRNDGNMVLDTGCHIFQTIAFEPNPFVYADGRLYNEHTKTYPVFLHGNGRTDMSKVKPLI